MENSTKKKTQNINNSSINVEVVFEYLHYWKWFVVSIVASLVIASAVILVSSKQYNPKLSVLLNEKTNSTPKSDGILSLESLGVLSTTNNIDNEMAILSSPDLMTLVVQAKKLDIIYYTKQMFRKEELYKNSPFTVSYTADSTYLKACNFYVQKNNDTYNVEGTFLLKNNEEHLIEKTFNSLPNSFTIDNCTINIVLSGQVFLENEKYYVSILPQSVVTNGLVDALSIVTSTKKSSVLSLELVVNNVDKGADILTELVHQYNEMNLRINNEMAYNTAIFINDRLKEISLELNDAEENVVEYKQKNKITDLSSEAQMFVVQTGEDETKLVELETQLNVLKLIQAFIDDPQNSTKIVPNLGITDISLSQIISEYNNRVLSSDVLLKGTSDQNPSRIRLMEELKYMRSNISNALKNVKESIAVTKKDQLRKSNLTQSRIKSVPKQEKGLIEKMREQKIKETLFLFLMQKREETNLSIASSAEKAMIIVSPQTEIPPIAPKPKIIIIAFLVIGILLPIIIIYVRNLFKVNIKDRDELERLSDVPIVGEIASVGKNEEMIIINDKNGAVAEMFRSLRNNIRFLIKNNNSSTILVTSTTSGEGKTFISVNLALSFAYTGKKVLLIGGDIRNPQLKTHIEASNSAYKNGLSNYLIDEDSNWEDYLSIPINEAKNMQVIYGGTIPPNPNELLMSPRLKQLIEEAKLKYDYIIIDSAPVGLVSDSYIISEFSDLTLYVARENKTPKAAVNFINSQKEEAKLKNFYLVMNGTTLTDNYKYGYGKGYGYNKKQ